MVIVSLLIDWITSLNYKLNRNIVSTIIILKKIEKFALSSLFAVKRRTNDRRSSTAAFVQPYDYIGGNGGCDRNSTCNGTAYSHTNAGMNSN